MWNAIQKDYFNFELERITMSEDLITLDDFERKAQTLIPATHLEYIRGGCSENRAIARARSAFERYRFVPRVLRGVGGTRNVSVSFFHLTNTYTHTQNNTRTHGTHKLMQMRTLP